MRKLLVGTAVVLSLIALGAAPAWAAHPFTGAPVVYVGLEKEYRQEAEFLIKPVGLRSIRLGESKKAARVLTEDPTDSDPAVSPDGRWIAFSRGGELFLMRADGSGARRLMDGVSSSGGEPSFVAGGRRILFVRRGDVYSVGIDGTGLRRITAGRSADRSPVASPNGRQIVFAREPFSRGEGGDPELDFSHIYSARPDGSRLRDLTPRIPARTPRIERRFSATDPAFSPNGRVIAFAVTGDGSVENVFTMRRDGSRLRSLTGGERPLSRNANLAQPAFSPSGRSLVVTARERHPSGETALAVIDLADRSSLHEVGGGVPGESAAFLPGYLSPPDRSSSSSTSASS